MPLSDSDNLMILRDTLRGLEADRLRASIMAVADEFQEARVPVLDAQIAEAQRRIDETEKEVAKGEAQAVEDERAAGVAAVEAADPGTFLDDYDNLAIPTLKQRAGLKGIERLLKSSDKKADIITQLRADDLRHPATG